MSVFRCLNSLAMYNQWIGDVYASESAIVANPIGENRVNPQRFDALAKALACGVTRRQIMKGLINGLGLSFLPKLTHASVAAQESPPIESVGGESSNELLPVDIDYFAIGDSIASGHGLDDVGGPCRQSRKAYPFAVARELRRTYRTVNFEDPEQLSDSSLPYYFWGCSGANTSLYEVLPALFNDVIANLSERPALVSVTVGANDFGWTDIFGMLRHLYLDNETDFRRWADEIVWGKGGSLDSPRAGGTWELLRTQVKKLVERDNVFVVLTQVYNPFNPKSVFFILNDPSICAWGDSAESTCFARIEYALDQLNSALNFISEDLEFNPSNGPRRVALTIGLRFEFQEHGSPRTTCGDAPPIVGKHRDDGKPRETGTWIQYRTDRRSNSFPFNGGVVPSWVPTALLGKIGDKQEWRGDCFHPNEDGAKYIAASVAKAALPLLAAMTLPLATGASSPEEAATRAIEALIAGDLTSLGMTYIPGTEPGSWREFWSGVASSGNQDLTGCSSVGYGLGSWAGGGCRPSEQSTDVEVIAYFDQGCGFDGVRNIHTLTLHTTRNEAGWFVSGLSGINGNAPEFGQPCVDQVGGETLPDSYLGTWAGIGIQTSPESEWPVVLTFTGGSAGEVVGTSAYETLGCEGELFLIEVEKGYPPFATFTETIFTGQEHCADGTFTVGWAEGIEGLYFDWTSADGESFARGDLTNDADAPEVCPPTSGIYISCGEESCVCGTTIDGEGLCLIQGTYRCGRLAECTSDSDCGIDEVCVQSAGCADCLTSVCWPRCPWGTAPRGTPGQC